jgi:hypothetical protein
MFGPLRAYFFAFQRTLPVPQPTPVVALIEKRTKPLASALPAVLPVPSRRRL